MVNAREARWRAAPGRGAVCPFGDDPQFPQLGVKLYALERGESMGMYHWEANQEDFLVLSGEGLLLVEGEERPLRQWDLVHCPPGASHMILGAGDEPCVVLAVGARSGRDPWGGYTVDDLARRHGASVERETSDADEAYANVQHRQPTRCRDGWLPR